LSTCAFTLLVSFVPILIVPVLGDKLPGLVAWWVTQVPMHIKGIVGHHGTQSLLWQQWQWLVWATGGTDRAKLSLALKAIVVKYQITKKSSKESCH